MSNMPLTLCGVGMSNAMLLWAIDSMVDQRGHWEIKGFERGPKG